MSAPDTSFTETARAERSADRVEEHWFDRVEALLSRASDQLNPIVVKEARQALKSRQFMITFNLLLVFGWGWSLLGVGLTSPGIRYAPGGPYMLIGYFFVLAFPLLVIVPFTAFRSLAGEREDGTYELLSITTLSPGQIVSGKLASSVLQMLVYLSALTPCLVFTYVLRGIDILTILTIVFYTFLGSLFCSMVGLVLATIARSRVVQVLLSVVLIVALIGAFGAACATGAVVVSQGGQIPFDEPDYWIGQLAFISFYATAFGLLYLAGAARLSPRSENRSSRLRVGLVVLQLLLIGWFVYLWLRSEESEVFFGLLTCLALQWYVAGTLLTGESSKLSSRVRRSLPQSFFGRMFLTWFTPGPGTGYVFAVVNLSASVLLVLLMTLVGELFDFSRGDEEIVWFGLLACAYVVLFLGAVRLVVQVIRRFRTFTMFPAWLLHVILLVAATLLPLIAQLFILWEDDYTPLQVLNPLWTLIETVDDDILIHGLPGLPFVPVVPVVVFALTFLVFVTNVATASLELRQLRTAVPHRVVEDEAELHPVVDPEFTPSSPWDEPA